MKRILSLVLVLGVAALFSSAALAGADCSYHKTQAAVEKTDASKDVATAPVPDNHHGARCRRLRPTNQRAKPASVTKK